jgi:hypothetical protein
MILPEDILRLTYMVESLDDILKNDLDIYEREKLQISHDNIKSVVESVIHESA